MAEVHSGKWTPIRLVAAIKDGTLLRVDRTSRHQYAF